MQSRASVQLIIFFRSIPSQTFSAEGKRMDSLNALKGIFKNDIIRSIQNYSEERNHIEGAGWMVRISRIEQKIRPS